MRTPAVNLAVEKQKAQAWAQWEELVHGALVNVMRQRKMGYKALSRELEKLGIYESPDQLNRKVNRKKFSAAFLFACLEAMDAKVALMPPSD